MARLNTICTSEYLFPQYPSAAVTHVPYYERLVGKPEPAILPLYLRRDIQIFARPIASVRRSSSIWTTMW